MDIKNDKRVVLTLDAGGTNFSFSAMRGGEFILDEPILKSAECDSLDKCIMTLINGFKEVRSKINKTPVAVSFAFPGPADYRQGIIGDLPNFRAFNGNVPLKGILENQLKLPVFINNDGNLFALGEALGGSLPTINSKLRAQNAITQYKTLVAITLGTGYGIGISINGQVLIGDSPFGPEIFCTTSRYLRGNCEEGVGRRAIANWYAGEIGIPLKDAPEPKGVYEIALGKREGDVDAAKQAFKYMGRIIGDTMANVLSVLGGGIITIGGGISQAKELFMPSMLKEMRTRNLTPDGGTCPRMVQSVYYLDDPQDWEKFSNEKLTTVIIPGTYKEVTYSDETKVGITISSMRADKAISLGAYACALEELEMMRL